MLKASISSDVLQSSVRAISALIEECMIKINADGLTMAAVDPANAAMVDTHIPSSAFTHFGADESEIGIDLRRFLEVLVMSEKGGDVNLEIDPETHKLNIDMNGLSYDMALLDILSMRKSPDIPQLDLPAEITLSGSEFKRMIKAASMTGDHLRIGVEGDTFFMLAKGDTDEVRLDIPKDDLIDLKPADVSSLYALDYLVDISKGIGNVGEIIINIGRDLPLCLDFEASKDCPVCYILAPRIESE